MPRIANKDARSWVQCRQQFEGSNTEGVRLYVPGAPRTLYAVFSFGRHWPMFVYHNDIWYENIERYSPTTSKHRTQLHPGAETVPCTTRALLDMIAGQGVPHRATESDMLFAA